MSCEGCEYWRYLTCRKFSEYYIKCCHFNIDKGRSRRRDGDICFEYTPENAEERKKRKRDAFFRFVVTNGGKSEYDEYSESY